MTSILYKWALQKTGLASAVKVGDASEDPYREEIPADELKFYQKKGAKRKKPIPAFLNQHDAQVLKTVRNRAYSLDLSLNLCGVRLGWSGIIGLIPWIGDIIAVLLALSLVKKARQVDGGLPEVIQAKMMANVTFDFGIGLIPIVGDFINIAYKANTRNYLLLEKHLKAKYNTTSRGLVDMAEHVPTTAATHSTATKAKPQAPDSADRNPQHEQHQKHLEIANAHLKT